MGRMNCRNDETRKDECANNFYPLESARGGRRRRRDDLKRGGTIMKMADGLLAMARIIKVMLTPVNCGKASSAPLVMVMLTRLT